MGKFSSYMDYLLQGAAQPPMRAEAHGTLAEQAMLLMKA
jgi:hypothetical protein